MNTASRKDALGNLTGQFEQSAKDQNVAEVIFGSDKCVLDFMVSPDASIHMVDEKPGLLSRLATKLKGK